MTINGHATPQKADEAVADVQADMAAVAAQVYDDMAEEGDEAWDELEPEVQDALIDHAQRCVAAGVAKLQARGFRIVPPNAAVKPQSDEEAAAMLQAVKFYREAQKRKGGLLGTGPRKLIVPPGMKH